MRVISLTVVKISLIELSDQWSKTYAKIGFKVFWSCLILLVSFAFCQIFGRGLRIYGPQRAYIKCIEGQRGERGGGFYKFFKKYFVAQETIDLNISWSSNFFRKYFMAPPINFSFLFKAYLQQYFRVVLSNIQISNHQRS